MKLLSTTQAAEVLGVSPRYVRQMVKDGKLPATRVGWNWVVTKKDLLEFVKTSRHVGRPGDRNQKALLNYPLND